MSTTKEQGDVFLESACAGDAWVYSETVREHFFNPRNLLLREDAYAADGYGVVGSAACGDMLCMWIKVDAQAQKITECKWRTFGCASAIASASMLSVMVTENGGMDLDRARKINPEEIVERLGGLPDRKFHCSVLGHLALGEAIDDYRNKQRHAADQA